jgi:hypothetical protein
MVWLIVNYLALFAVDDFLCLIINKACQRVFPKKTTWLPIGSLHCTDDGVYWKTFQLDVHLLILNALCCM